MEIDKTDVEILRVLEKNARLSLRKIAKRVGVSVATVMHRINRLEKEGVIRKYIALLDYDKLGYELEAVISVDVAKGKLFEVEKKIATDPSVHAVYDITGHFDVVVVARFKTRKSLDTFVKKIQTYAYVEKTETAIVLNTIKEDPMGI